MIGQTRRLEWALGESQCALASFSNGSHDGLERMANNDALVCGLHLHEGEHWNVSHVQRVFSGKPVVLIEFATRARGLILSRQITARVSALHDLRGLRVAHRQSSAASQCSWNLYRFCMSDLICLCGEKRGSILRFSHSWVSCEVMPLQHGPLKWADTISAPWGR